MRYQYLFGLLFFFFATACTKFLEIDPPQTQLVSSVVFNNDASATAALTGIYGQIMQDNNFASINTTYYGGLSADEMIDYSNQPVNVQINQNTIDAFNTNIQFLWGNAYHYIYSANAVLEGLDASASVSPALKKELIAEARFIRAFCNFYLVSFFGDIPLVMTTDYQVNAQSARTPAEQVFQQIIIDLKAAQADLPTDYAQYNGERVRPTYWAASALLARAYLYRSDWTDAETQATAVINHAELFSLVPNPDSVFLANSNESIWQLQPIAPGYDTYEGFVFILTGNPTGNDLGVALDNRLIASFHPRDRRLDSWIHQFSDPTTSQEFFYPYKYKIASGDTRTEYYTVLRLAELFLIRAEARARLNNLTGGLEDLNQIRQRAGLPDNQSGDNASLLSSIAEERRFELFAEWGHRWFDLKRTGTSDYILSPVKIAWQPTDTLYPIPATERQNDPNLTQNPGYN